MSPGVDYQEVHDPHTTSTALTFVLAPLPNALFAHCGGDEFSSYEANAGPIDLGRFITSVIVVSGFALPVVLTHSEVIRPGACVMSTIGGGCVLLSFRTLTFNSSFPRLVYGTILAYSAAFVQDDSEFD